MTKHVKQSVMPEKLAADLNLEIIYSGRGVVTLSSMSVERPGLQLAGFFDYFDSRRVIVDERAPLYFIGSEQTYSPMLFVVSDQDMKNRYEQTMLTLSTLKHFGHEEIATLRVMSGTHCHYLKAFNENGENLFGKIVLDYLKYRK